ncbi:MAG: hypothetical protein FWB91_07365 [Defluviitaleaceae bacterium]|nr:hypothetical protein [Defluviitaleaceae bacterium]
MRGVRNKRNLILLVVIFALVFIVGVAYAFSPSVLEVHVGVSIPVEIETDEYPEFFYPPEITTGPALYVRLEPYED